MERFGRLCFLGISRARICIIASLAITWWLAHLVPRYKPAIQQQVTSTLQDARKMIPNIKLNWPTVEGTRTQYNSSKLALLIEPRPLPQLVPLILHMISVVPPDWRFLVIGSQDSKFSVGRAHAIKWQQALGKLDLVELPHPWAVQSTEDVFRLMTDVRFYDQFLPGVEWVLKYEHDSLLCANSETSLDDWLDWSWAGSTRIEGIQFTGNGGLSLRRVSIIRRILSFQVRHNNSEPEDEWFGKRLLALPGAKIASNFGGGALALESLYTERPMGYQVRSGGFGLNDDVWIDPETRKQIFDYCPELSMIMDMKLERERCPGDDGGGNIEPLNTDDGGDTTEQEQEEESESHEETTSEPPDVPPLPMSVNGPPHLKPQPTTSWAS